MKELNNNEMQAVSGAGFLSDFAGSVGGAMGNMIDIIRGSNSTAFADTFRKIATNIAGTIESGFSWVGGLFGSKSATEETV